MELCEGGDVWGKFDEADKFERTHKGQRLEEMDVKRVVQQTLLALVYLHGQKCVHRDIKPENLLYRTSAESSEIAVSACGRNTLHSSIFDAVSSHACVGL